MEVQMEDPHRTHDPDEPPDSSMQAKQSHRHSARLVEMLRRENRALRRDIARLMAERATVLFDQVSGLHNRTYFDGRLSQEFGRALRHGEELSLVIVQIHQLRAISDHEGAASAEDLLRWVATTTSSSCREFDIGCRIGDDEIGVVLPATSNSGAIAFVKRLARKLASSAGDSPVASEGVKIQLSFGVASAPMDAETPIELIIAAEESLFVERSSKSRGSGGDEAA